MGWRMQRLSIRPVSRLLMSPHFCLRSLFQSAYCSFCLFLLRCLVNIRHSALSMTTVMVSEKTILITGCSQGGLGDALARALRQRGHRVIATARNPAKMSHFQALGIEILNLDVLSEESIAQCVKTVAAQHNGAVDILINNSGAGYSIPLTDASLAEARRLFDLNVWSGLAMIEHKVEKVLNR